MIEVPDWFNAELAAVGASCAWSRWGRKNYVIPPVGMKYWRYVRMQDGKYANPGAPGSYVVMRYDGLHHLRRNLEFRPPSRCVTDGRLVIFQPIPGAQRYERVVDLVTEDGELLEPSTMILVHLAHNRAVWQDEREHERQEEQAAAAVAKADEEACSDVVGEAWDRLVTAESAGDTWVYMNDQKKPTEPGFHVIDKRRFAAPTVAGG